MKRRKVHNTRFASGGVTYKIGALCPPEADCVQVDPEVSGCSETRPNAKPETASNYF
jgi:hypothetical protein